MSDRNEEFKSALLQNNFKVVSELLDEKVSLNDITLEYDTVEFSGDNILVFVSLKGFLKTAEVLLDYGVDVDILHPMHAFPIYWSLLNCDKAMTELLISRKADINAKIKSLKNTALHKAAIMSNMKAVEYILSFDNVDATIQNGEGKTPDQLATTKEIRMMILRHQRDKMSQKLKLVKLATIDGEISDSEQKIESLRGSLTEEESILVVLKETKKRLESDDEESNRIYLDEKQMKCPICYEVPPPSTHVFQCPQGHWYCAACRQNMPQVCPQCRQPIEQPIRNLFIEHLISN